MARLSRVYIDNACYHITVRGNRKKQVFLDEIDHLRCLHIIRKAKKVYGTPIYAYCLMPNHIHLLIDPHDSRKISSFMHWVNRGYTAYFNSRYTTVGHLWQGRFQSRPIIKGAYLINCATYIEMNPVRANIVKNPEDYAWSSYRERCFGNKNDSGILDEIEIEYSEKVAGTALICKMGTGCKLISKTVQE